MNIKINGNIISEKEIDHEEFWDKFIDFLESNDMEFIGITEEIVDEYMD